MQLHAPLLPHSSLAHRPLPSFSSLVVRPYRKGRKAGRSLGTRLASQAQWASDLQHRNLQVTESWEGSGNEASLTGPMGFWLAQPHTPLKRSRAHRSALVSCTTLALCIPSADTASSACGVYTYTQIVCVYMYVYSALYRAYYQHMVWSDHYHRRSCRSSKHSE